MPIDTSKTKFKEGSDKEWALLPEDTYQVQLTDITEKETEYNGEKKNMLQFEFTVIEQHEFEDNGRKCYTYGRKLWKKGSIVAPVPSRNNKDPLTYKVASAILGHKLTKEEGEHWTMEMLNALIGKQLRIGLTISAPKPDGKQFNNVDLFYMAKQPLPPFDEKLVKVDEEKKAVSPGTVLETATAQWNNMEPEEADFGEVTGEDIPL